MLKSCALAAGLVLFAGAAWAEATHTVEAGSFAVKASYTGTFAALESTPVSLSPDIWSGFEVVEAVAHGSRVEEGATLVRFDATDLDEKIGELEHASSMAVLSLQRARAELQLLEQTIELDLGAAARARRMADQALERYQSSARALAVRSAEESLRASEYSLEYAQEELKQLQQMYDADDLTEETEEIVLTRQRRAVEASKFRLERAKERHQQTLAESIPEREEELTDRARRAEISQAKSTLVQPLEREKKRLEVASLERKWQRSVEQLAKHRKDRELMVVPAPATGIVYYGRVTDGKVADASAIGSKTLSRGGKVSPREVFMTIVSEGPLGIAARIEEKLLADIKEGVTGVAVPTAFPDRELPVRVGAVSLVPIKGGEFSCPTAIVDGADTTHLLPGMTCKLECVVYERDDALTVPVKAVRGKDDARHVIALRDGVRERREVKVGRSSGGRTEILDGVSEGDVIALPEK